MKTIKHIVILSAVSREGPMYFLCETLCPLW